MAKYHHRIFEMYDFLDEAILALTPRSVKPATESTLPESWFFTRLAVSRSEAVTHVQFKNPGEFGGEPAGELRGDLQQLAEKLGRDSKVLVDFAGVSEVRASDIDALIEFKKKLQNQGSRIALCGLEPAARESFFVAR